MIKKIFRNVGIAAILYVLIVMWVVQDEVLDMNSRTGVAVGFVFTLFSATIITAAGNVNEDEHQDGL